MQFKEFKFEDLPAFSPHRVFVGITGWGQAVGAGFLLDENKPKNGLEGDI